MEAGEGKAAPTGSHRPNKLAYHPAKTLPPPQPSSCGESPIPALDQRRRSRPRRDGGSYDEQESAIDSGERATREELILLIGWSRPERIGFLPKILRAAKLAQGPFLSSISFGPAKEMDPAGRAWKLRRQSLPTGSHNPNKLAHRPAKRPLSRNQAPAGNYPTPALDQRPRNRPRRDGGSCYEQESATENGKLYTREGLILLIGWSRPERIGFLPKILRAAEIAQGPFLSSISFGPAKEMDPAGRAWKLGRQSLHTGSRAKGAPALTS